MSAGGIGRGAEFGDGDIQMLGGGVELFCFREDHAEVEMGERHFGCELECLFKLKAGGGERV